MTAPDAVEALAAALDSAWPKHFEGSGGTNIETRSWEVPDPWAGKGGLAEGMAAALAAAGWRIVREEPADWQMGCGCKIDGLHGPYPHPNTWQGIKDAHPEITMGDAPPSPFYGEGNQMPLLRPAPPPALDVERCPCGHLNATCTRPTLAERYAYEREGE